MAKTISDEVMKLSIVINGNEGQKALFDLEKATRKLNEENKALGLQKKQLEKQGKQETEQYKLLSASMKANSAEIVSNKAKMKILQDQIGLTGLTISQLQSKATMLRNTLRNMVPGSADYIKFNNELKQVNTRLAEVSGKAKQTKLSLGSMADGFNRYQGMALSFVAILTGMVLSVQKILDINGKLAGAQSNVMKTTQMTRQEVDELTKSFGLLHTRTSRINLLGIAEQGGRIGIAKEEIGAFVNVMNKAAVSLGDSFTGGAEEVANKLGKIKFLFQETKDLGVEQTYNSIGSAINDLGANGVASEQNIADFTTRIGSLTDVLKPTIQETLALGAAFEESGIESEVSSRAYGIFMNRASTGAGDFAKVMGISKKAVEDMINTNPMEFMLQFAEGMKGMDATEVAKTLDFLKINADGANKVIGAMGNNTSRFRELIDLSNKSFADGTSLINEYNIKNNDLEAILERLSKTVSGWFTSETFVKWLTISVSWLAKFIGAIEDTDGKATAWKNTLVFTAKVIAIVTAAMVTNVSWQKLVALWTTRNTEATLLYNIAAKARAFADGVAMVASQAYAATTMLLTGNLKGAQQAFRVLTATMMTTPWGFILGAIAAIGTAYLVFRDNIDEAAIAQKMMSDIHAEASGNIAKQKAEVDLLTKMLKDENISREKKIKIIERLNELIPDHIGHLTLENIKTAEGIGILKQYTDELYKNARAKAVQSKFDELAKQKVEVERKSVGDLRKEQTLGFLGTRAYDNFTTRKDFEDYVSKNFGKASADKQKDIVDKMISGSALSDKMEQLARLDAQMKALEPEIVTNTIKDLDDNSNGPKEGDKKTISGIGYTFKGGKWVKDYNVPGVTGGEGSGKSGSTKNPNSSQEEINRIKLDRESKYNDELLKLNRQLEDDKIAAMQDGYQKELLIENQRYKREIDDLERQKIHADDLAKLDEDIAKAKESKDISKYNDLMTIRKGWDEKNKVLDDRIDAIKEGKMAIHKQKLATIEEKAATEAINKKKEAFDREKQLREIKFNEEINKLGKNKIAKRKLTEKYEQDELVYQENFLRELINDFNKIIGEGVFNEIDLSLLTPEQVQAFTDEAAKVGLTLSELIAKKNELSGKQKADNQEALGVSGGQADIFGFTPENWLQLQDNLAAGKAGIDEMVFAVSALTNAYGMYSKFLEINEKKQLATFERNTNTKKARYKQQLDTGRITQEQYNRYVEKADDDLAKKKAQIENKQAKRQKAITISQIAMNTAMAIMGIWAQFPKFDFGATAAVMSGVVGALGLAQIAMVAKQPLPSASGYEEGLYPEYVKREQDGKVFKSKPAGKTRSGLVTNTSHFMVAENGPEMVIDNKAWTKMNPAVKDALIRDLQGIKGWENGYYNEQLKRYEVPAGSGSTPAPSPTNDSELLLMVLGVLQENTEVMRDIRENGLEAFVSNKDFKSMKNIREGLKKEDALRKNNQIR